MIDETALTEEAEETLAQLWGTAESRALGAGFVNPANAGFTKPAPNDGDPAVAELVEAGLVARCAAGGLSLTDAGQAEGASIIRRERLAERLLTDVLALGEAEVEQTACKFEHLLRRGIDDEICTLLGHPRVCPHGSPIPPGECCRLRSHAAEKVVSSLADLAPGQSGVVAYLHGRRRELIQRMLTMGVIPGAPVTLLQSAPSYVFELGQAQLAVDRETAQDIYVRLAEGPRPHPRKRGWLPTTVRGLRRRRGRG